MPLQEGSGEMAPLAQAWCVLATGKLLFGRANFSWSAVKNPPGMNNSQDQYVVVQNSIDETIRANDALPNVGHLEFGYDPADQGLFTKRCRGLLNPLEEFPGGLGVVNSNELKDLNQVSTGLLTPPNLQVSIPAWQ